MKYTIDLETINDFCGKLGMYSIEFYRDLSFEDKCRNTAKKISIDPNSKTNIYFSTYRESKFGKTREEIQEINKNDDTHKKFFSFKGLKCEIYGKDERGNEISYDCSTQWEEFLKNYNFIVYKNLKEEKLLKRINKDKEDINKYKSYMQKLINNQIQTIEEFKQLKKEYEQNIKELIKRVAQTTKEYNELKKECEQYNEKNFLKQPEKDRNI